MKYVYAIIPDSSIDMKTKKVALMALAGAMKEFCLGPVNIKWFCDARWEKSAKDTFERDTELQGEYRWADANSIYVQAYQMPDAIAETVLHEVAHLAGKRATHGCGNGGQEESLVRKYVIDMMRRGVHKDMDAYIDYLAGKDWSVKPKTEAKAPYPPASTKPGAASGNGYHKKTNGRISR